MSEAVFEVLAFICLFMATIVAILIQSWAVLALGAIAALVLLNLPVTKPEPLP